MTVYEDDPRARPKLQSYGGSTSRGSAKRGNLKASTGSTPGEKKDPRLPAAPKKPGKDRQQPNYKPPAETPLNWHLRAAGPVIDSAIREVMKAASPFTAWMEKLDSSKNPSKPDLKDWLAGEETNQKLKEFKRGGEGGGSQDQGIQANPPGLIPRKPQTTGKFGPGHLPPYKRPPITPERRKQLEEEYRKWMEENKVQRDKGIEA